MSKLLSSSLLNWSPAFENEPDLGWIVRHFEPNGGAELFMTHLMGLGKTWIVQASFLSRVRQVKQLVRFAASKLGLKQMISFGDQQ